MENSTEASPKSKGDTTNTNANANNTTDPQGNPKKQKEANKNIKIPPKKPKLSKKERRELQERQRAAKAAASGGGGGNAKKNTSKKEPNFSSGDKQSGGGGGGGGRGDAVSSVDARGSGSGGGKGGGHEKTPSLFSHLPPYRDHDTFREQFSGISLGPPIHTTHTSNNNNNNNTTNNTHHNLHPAVLSLGLQYANGSIRGANARCRAMLRTFQTIISDYTTTTTTTNNNNNNNNDIRQHLEQSLLKPSFTYWTTHCRPHSTSMGNAFTFLKLAVANLDRDVTVPDAISQLNTMIEAYIDQRIDLPKTAISKNAATKIVDGDVILTYGNSEVVQHLLEDAANPPLDETGGSGGGGGGNNPNHHTKKPKQFRLVIVDSRPLLEGRKLLQKFTSDPVLSQNVDCTYVQLNALSYVMLSEVTKVFLGAASLMCDGSVMSRVGTASVAMMARRKNIPVLVCCETYKISTRVQLESITGNELGCPDDLVFTGTGGGGNGGYSGGGGGEEKKEGGEEDGGDGEVLKNWRQDPNLKLLNLLYDLTPSEFVSGIITEMGILPPTSVAVLVREMSPQESESYNAEDYVP